MLKSVNSISAAVALALGLLVGMPDSAAWAQSTPAPATSAGTAESAPDLEAKLKALEAKIQELAAAVEALRKQSEPGDAAKIAELEKQIDALTREIEMLKLGEAATPTAGKSVHGLGPAASKVYQVREGVSLGGYGEMTYRGFSGQEDSGTPSGMSDRLDLLRAVFYFGYKWNDKLLFNSEIEF